jgi:hypothetical protein
MNPGKVGPARAWSVVVPRAHNMRMGDFISGMRPDSSLFTQMAVDLLKSGTYVISTI